uniref:SMC hinge domain-containing protein n=1 Tax=Panagrolaimus sp. ES5 TaxID=591445 RepID=A0AC34GRX0_9BILA
MRLKKLEIEGFKSYANRVVITDFDKSFNAITGYNGTGKSNVLDAICFVLGISNIKQVRAQHLADLIYKQGQAGISKASVAATFEHNDKNHRVPGFDLGKDIVVRRQIVLNGRSTYTVNGSNATNNKIADMFRSVGMNVNNPHFLIMQGRIGKVLNMNPKEIIAMVEEAVGVRIYESRKVTCIRLIEKKQTKMEEISRILDENIQPMIQKLTSERDQYLRFDRLNIEIQKLNKRITAYEYIQTEQNINKYLEKAEEKDNENEEIGREIEEAKARIQELIREKEELARSKENSIDNDKVAIETKLKTLQAVQVQAESTADEAKSEIKREKEDLKNLGKSKEKAEKELGKLRTKLDTMNEQIGSDVKALEDAQSDLQKAQREQDALQRNMVTDADGNEVHLNDLKMKCSTELTTTRTVNTDSKQRLTQIEGLIKGLERDITTKKDTGCERLIAEKAQLVKNIERLQNDIRNIAFDETQEVELSRKMQEAQTLFLRLRDDSENFFSRHNHLRFEYKRPPPNVPFDENDLYGQLFKLFKVKDKKYHRAIEIAAGGALNSIVTRTGRIAQDLLHHKCLHQRSTFAPLDSVSGHWVSDDVVRRARQRCKGEVFSVADIIEYDPKYEKAMKFAFGGRLICKDRDDAAIIAHELKVRAITLIGEDVSPHGTASGGGGSAKESKLMTDIENFNNKDADKKQAGEDFENLKREQRQLQEKSQRFRQFTEELAQSEARIRTIENQLKQSVTHMLEEDLAKLRVEREEKIQLINEYAAKIPEMEKQLRHLEESAKNQAAYIAKKMKEAKELEASAKKRLKECDATKKKEDLDKIKVDVENLEESIEQTEKDIQAKKEFVEQLEVQFQDVNAKLKEAVDAVTAEEAVANMEKSHPFLKQDKKFFNTPGSDYDFTNFNYEESKVKRDEKVAERQELSQNINPNAGKLLESNEEQALDLMKKRKIIETDREQLYITIANLDEKKRREMTSAYHIVNDAFGSIFSTLLPGAQAKLVPTTGATIENLDNGLEFKVGFNNLWKESLSELSGGQKSLVALSLILSLLRFKPAPLYILDEIDAALDISHTSNIGVLIKKHFSNAQFIVVSLKPGMFKNANAIFRTRLADGVSSIARVQDDIVEDFEKEN